MLRPLIPRLLCVASAALFASTPVAAQNTITLEGVVRGDGAPVVGAQITVRNIATAELSRTLTRATGEFRILGLYSGQYTVNVKAIGYRQR
ncbi:carboxypeptidase-like regulatory domain-containing protein, partial [Gemmatimonas sp.]|uniref:carboxypeptidase-like regulatory domain-containing protein n=1 Tax=Gemmatimonas sp. TaxID=1962908 RepID=UPI0027B8BB7D